MRALGPLCLLLLAGACAAPPEEPRTALPDRWDAVEPFAFERLLATAFADGGVEVYFDREGYKALQAALDRMDESSVRAALLLAHSRHPTSGRILMDRLRKRVEGPTRESDAGDVVAAAALATFPHAADLYRKDLKNLAVGGRPHPDLDVRVECACAALALGDDAPIAFLIDVLRIDTYSGHLEAGEHTAWPRSRAARALSERAGVPCRYHPDASIADRELEAARLERLLRSNGALRT